MRNGQEFSGGRALPAAAARLIAAARPGPGPRLAYSYSSYSYSSYTYTPLLLLATCYLLLASQSVGSYVPAPLLLPSGRGFAFARSHAYICRA
jgi:hypothetical protein